MTNTNDEYEPGFGRSSFVLRSYFVIRHSCFVISQRCLIGHGGLLLPPLLLQEVIEDSVDELARLRPQCLASSMASSMAHGAVPR